MTATHISPVRAAENTAGGAYSTYVRTVVCIRNTYIHTYALAPKPPEIAGHTPPAINAYFFRLSRGCAG